MVSDLVLLCASSSQGAIPTKKVGAPKARPLNQYFRHNFGTNSGIINIVYRPPRLRVEVLRVLLLRVEELRLGETERVERLGVTERVLRLGV